VLDHFSVGALLMGPFETDRPLEQAILARCSDRGIPVRRLARGDLVPFGNSAIEVLHPPRDCPNAAGVNDRSLVLRLELDGVRLLLSGDIEAAGEAILAQHDCAADILKAPHHGSGTSSTSAFLDAVSPAYCVISTGRLRGEETADPEVMRRYQDRGIQVWRTDVSGAVVATFKEGVHIRGVREGRGYPVPSALAAPR
jgi:competence protein ComEC